MVEAATALHILIDRGVVNQNKLIGQQSSRPVVAAKELSRANAFQRLSVGQARVSVDRDMLWLLSE